MKLTQVGDSEWITPREAVNQLSHVAGSDAAAKTLIADNIFDGEISITAKWMALGADLGPISTQCPQVSATLIGPYHAREVTLDRDTKMFLGPAFWRDSHDWQSDVARWDWGGAIFVVSKPPPKKTIRSTRTPELVYGTRHTAGGLMLAADHIASIAGRLAGTPVKPKKPRGNGGRTRSEHWIEWTAELVQLERDGELQDSMSATALCEALNKRLTARGMEEVPNKTAHRTANAVLLRLR